MALPVGGLPWPGIGVPLVLAAGLARGRSPATVLAVAVVLVGEAVAGLAKQRRGTLTTGAPEEGHKLRAGGRRTRHGPSRGAIRQGSSIRVDAKHPAPILKVATRRWSSAP
jgi:hypothetical protein